MTKSPEKGADSYGVPWDKYVETNYAPPDIYHATPTTIDQAVIATLDSDIVDSREQGWKDFVKRWLRKTRKKRTKQQTA